MGVQSVKWHVLSTETDGKTDLGYFPLVWFVSPMSPKSPWALKVALRPLIQLCFPWQLCPVAAPQQGVRLLALHLGCGVLVPCPGLSVSSEDLVAQPGRLPWLQLQVGLTQCLPFPKLPARTPPGEGWNSARCVPAGWARGSSCCPAALQVPAGAKCGPSLGLWLHRGWSCPSCAAGK